jgi:CDGSH-type Zn-finger protein
MAKTKNKSQKETQYKVTVTTNGPYVVSGGVPLSEQNISVDSDGQSHGWKEGQKYPTQESYALCRCGRSRNKPYCDGAHTEKKFDGTETASHTSYLEQAGEIDGPSLKLTDSEGLCAGARFCDRAGGIWELTQESNMVGVNYFCRITTITFAGLSLSVWVVLFIQDAIPPDMNCRLHSRNDSKTRRAGQSAYSRFEDRPPGNRPAVTSVPCHLYIYV